MRYLEQGFCPQRTEFQDIQARLEGDWPDTLHGTLYRIGPNPQFDPIPPYNPLLSDGMIHAFRINGRGNDTNRTSVTWRNRWVRTQQWQLEREAGRALFATSGNPSHHDPEVRGVVTDGVANTNLVAHHGRLLALEEGHPPVEVDPDTLDTRGPYDFSSQLPHNMTAHPKVDPVTGEMVFIANLPGGQLDGTILIHSVDSQGSMDHTAVVTAPWTSLIHDFAVTRNFTLLLICPLTISVERALAGGPPLAWEPDRATRIGILSRRGSVDEIRWLETGPCFVWHTANAWEQGDTICLELCEQNAPAFPTLTGEQTDPSEHCQYFVRWTVDLSVGSVTRKRLSGLVCEYPRFDERLAMQKSRHTWFACHGGPGTEDLFHRGIGHYDSREARMRSFHFGERCAVSEPVLIPDPHQSREYLGVVVYDESSDCSHLALLDALAVEAGPVARAWLDQRVPMGFHGIWDV